MPVPLKIALNLLADNSIKVKAACQPVPQSWTPSKLNDDSTERLSRMDALQGQACAKARHYHQQQELWRIEQAFERMATGQFGYCIECQSALPLAQLESDPTATHCPECTNCGSLHQGTDHN